jgi:ferredoxin
MCLHFASGAFALDAKGQATVVDAAGDTAENILEAAEQCPQGAITLEEVETGERVFP